MAAKKNRNSKKQDSSELPKHKHGSERAYISTGVPGLDKLFAKNGVPVGSSVIIAGGAGSGKTILCLQLLVYHASRGKTCLYMSFEEDEGCLMNHMRDFGWDPDRLIKAGTLKIKKYSPFEISRSVEAVLAKERGELMIDLDPVILQEKKKFDIIVLDSLTAVASIFAGRDETYRIYVTQLFRLLEQMGSTSFMITETKEVPDVFSTTGTEEFMADGVIVLYNARRGNIRESAIEVLKMRGEKHEKKLVAMEITDKGVVVYPEQEAFGLVNEG